MANLLCGEFQQGKDGIICDPFCSCEYPIEQCQKCGNTTHLMVLYNTDTLAKYLILKYGKPANTICALDEVTICYDTTKTEHRKMTGIITLSDGKYFFNTPNVVRELSDDTIVEALVYKNYSK